MIARGPASSRSGTPLHFGLSSRRWKRALPVSGWPETHVALPGERLDQRAGAVVEDRLQVPVGAVFRQCLAQLGDRQRPVLQRLADGGAEVGPVRRAQPVVLDPARQLPLPTRCPEGEVDAPVFGREVVHRPAEREDVDHVSVGDSLCELAGLRRCASGADRQLGQRLVHRQDCAEPADNASGCVGRNRIEEVALHPPAQRFCPGDRDLGLGAHPRSISPVPSNVSGSAECADPPLAGCTHMPMSVHPPRRDRQRGNLP